MQKIRLGFRRSFIQLLLGKATRFGAVQANLLTAVRPLGLAVPVK